MWRPPKTGPGLKGIRKGWKISLSNLLDRQKTFLLCMDGKQKKVALGAGESLVWDMTEG